MSLPHRPRIWPWALAALAGWGTLLALRLWAMRSGWGAYVGCPSCVDAPVLLNDLLPTALLLGCVAAAALLRPGWTRLPLALLALALVLIYVLDLGITLIFGLRLRAADLLRYGGETRSAWSVLAPVLAEPRGMALATGLALALLGWPGLVRALPRRAAIGLGLGTVAAAALAATLLAPTSQSIEAGAFRDVLRGNWPDGLDRPHSPAFRAALAQAPGTPPEQHCTAAASGPARPVILLVVESLSAHHSALLGGAHDTTPQLDAWARQASYFPDFHANGFTTDGGLIALLTGRVPLPAIGRYQSMHAYAGYEQAIVPKLFDQLKHAGYQSQFFTTGNLGFLDKGGWLKGLGFEHVEGAEHPFYADQPRGAFDAASDQALYQRYLDWYDHQRSGALNFSTLLTVSTHPPFAVPGTSVQDERSAFHWADAQIGAFIQTLAQRGYFDRGVLLVLGDHRAMSPPRPEQLDQLGAGVGSRVPLVVVGPAGLPAGPVPGRWQQTDFLAGLQEMAALPSCTDAFRGRLLGRNARPARYVLHAQAAQRDRVRVWTAGSAEPHDVILDGDDTRWASAPAEASAPAAVIDHINRARAALAPVPASYIDLMVGRKLAPP